MNAPNPPSVHPVCVTCRRRDHAPADPCLSWQERAEVAERRLGDPHLRSLAGEVLLRHGFKVAAADRRMEQCELGVRNAADTYDRHRGGRLASVRLGDREHELRQANEARTALDADPARLLALAVLALPS